MFFFEFRHFTPTPLFTIFFLKGVIFGMRSMRFFMDYLNGRRSAFFGKVSKLFLDAHEGLLVGA